VLDATTAGEEEATASGVEDVAADSGGASASMNTVRVLVDVRPVGLVATQSMVSVATFDVSSTMSLTSAPLRKYFRPRFWSAWVGPVMAAPRSAWLSPKWTMAGLAPFHSNSRRRAGRGR
jgi:hypothetical protein